MSSEFIIAFVSTCEAEGLSKEATAELLQRQSVIHECEQSPAFAAGFEKIALMVPGELRPLAREGYFEKQAGPNARLAWQGIKSLGQAAGGAVSGAARATGRGLDKLVGTGPSSARTGRTTPSWAGRNPTGAALGGIGVGGAGVGVGMHMLGGGTGSPAGAPYMPPGGFNPDEAAASYDTQLDQHSRGLAEHNKKFFGDRKRQEVLQQAVDSNSPNSAQALAELSRIKRDQAAVSADRANHIARFDSVGGQSASKLKEIEEQQAAMERAKTSWTRAPQRAWLWMTGRDPNQYFDDKRVALEGGASAAQTAQRLSEDQLRRLENGYIGGQTKSKTPAQMQQEFFPKYD